MAKVSRSTKIIYVVYGVIIVGGLIVGIGCMASKVPW